MAYVGVDYLICIQNLYNSKKTVVLFIFELPYSIQQKKNWKTIFCGWPYDKSLRLTHFSLRFAVKSENIVMWPTQFLNNSNPKILQYYLQELVAAISVTPKKYCLF